MKTESELLAEIEALASALAVQITWTETFARTLRLNLDVGGPCARDLTTAKTLLKKYQS